MTLDLNCRIFTRPVHLKVEIIRKLDEGDKGNKQDHLILGTKIIEVDELHAEIWTSGLQNLEKMKQSKILPAIA